MTNRTNSKSLSHNRKTYEPSNISNGNLDYDKIAQLNEREKDRLIYSLLEKLSNLVKSSCVETNPNRPQPNPYRPQSNPYRPQSNPYRPQPNPYQPLPYQIPNQPNRYRPLPYQIPNQPIRNPYKNPTPNDIFPSRPGIWPQKPDATGRERNPIRPYIPPANYGYGPTEPNRYPTRTSTPSYSYTRPDTTRRPTTKPIVDMTRPPIYPAEESYGRYLYISENKFWSLYNQLIKSSHDKEFYDNLNELEQYVIHAQRICEKSKEFSNVLSRIKRPPMISNTYDSNYLTYDFQPRIDSADQDNYERSDLYNYANSETYAYNNDNDYSSWREPRFSSSYEQYQAGPYDQESYEVDEQATDYYE